MAEIVEKQKIPRADIILWITRLIKRKKCAIFTKYSRGGYVNFLFVMFRKNDWKIAEKFMFLICDISNKNCQQLYLRNVTVFWVDNLFKTHSSSRPVSSGTQRQTGGAWRVRAVASNRETMRGIWICQSQVPAFFSKHKLFIYEFIDFRLSSCSFLFSY